MKTSLLYKTFLAAAIAGVSAGCSENAWNNHLDGFEDLNNEPIANKQSIEYTLTDADYSAIASNATNKQLAGDALKNALAAVGTQKAFSADIPAAQYVPAFLGSTSFPYFTLTQGSAVKLTYNVAENPDPALAVAAQAQLYTVTSDEYRETVWESEDNYIDAFAPSKPASRYISRLLADNLDAGDGEYVIVTYHVTDQEPVFGNVGGGDDEPAPEFKLSNVLGSVALDQTVTASAVVTAICQQGYILTDASGSVFSYCGSAFDPESLAIGDQVNVTGTIGSYNRGFQFVANKPDVAYDLTIVGHQDVTYPAPKVYTGEELEAALGREGNETAIYCRINATVALSGNYINLNVDGATTARGSVYQATAAQKAAFTDGAQVTVEGYFIAIAGTVNCNIVVTSVNGTAVSRVPARRNGPVADVPVTAMNAVYRYNGSSWVEAENFVVLNPGDYTAMGQAYQNLTEPDLYLPKYLANKYPYAQAEQFKNVLYKLYKNSVTAYACDQYVYNGSEWVLNNNIVTETNQFVYTPTGWMYDPNVTITLPAGRGQEFSAIYYQACTDWVYENICVPLGDTSIKSGKFYVTSYGNNEYYSGTSAYQNNIDLRPDKAREQYPAGYEGMTDDEIVALEKQRFMNEVMPGALGMIHPDAKPIDGLEVLYTIHFAVYTGSTSEYTAVFKVVGPGQFEPVSCTWDD